MRGAGRAGQVRERAHIRGVANALDKGGGALKPAGASGARHRHVVRIEAGERVDEPGDLGVIRVVTGRDDFEGQCDALGGAHGSLLQKV